LYFSKKWIYYDFPKIKQFSENKNKKYAYTIALTLGCLLLALKGLKLAFRWLQAGSWR
jgi:hypothetical protein